MVLLLVLYLCNAWRLELGLALIFDLLSSPLDGCYTVFMSRLGVSQIGGVSLALADYAGKSARGTKTGVPRWAFVGVKWV